MSEPIAPAPASRAATTPEPPGLPATLGRYRIVAELGRGAMGTVFHGIDATIGRPVALKTLNAELPADILGEVRERFLREAKSAGQLNHPNIVTIYEFGQDGNAAFIAMEFLQGKSLQQVIREGRLPFATIADLVAQIADGLEYAHRFGVVHRDIKPANIMVTPLGLAKLTDFGIARIESSSMTQTGAMLGSPKYMSPEQVLGQPVDGRADIFSLGVVLYEMLAARTPFETPDATVFSLMQRIVTVPHDSILQAVPGTPPAFELILARALAKRPEQRYQRAGEFANDLRNFRTLALPGAAADATDKTVLVSRSGVWPPGAQPANAPAVAPGPAPAFTSNSAFERTVVTSPEGTHADGPPAAAVVGVSTGATAQGSSTALADTLVTPARTPALLDNFDDLGTSLDEMQRKFLAEEGEAMAAIRRGASKSKDWGGMAGSIEAPAPTPGPSDPAATAPGAARKSSVFGLLRQQTGPNLKEQAEAKLAAEAAAMLAFDAKLRSGYAFLTEFFREVNDANPQYAAKHRLPFYGDCPPMYFSAGNVNARTRRIEDRGKIKEIIDHLIVSYHLLSPERRKVTLNAMEMPTFQQILAEHEMRFDMSDTRNDFKQVIRASFNVEIKFTCALTLRADYATQTVDLACRNIGPLGRRRFHVPASMLSDELFEELTKLMLGYPSAMIERFAVAA